MDCNKGLFHCSWLLSGNSTGWSIWVAALQVFEEMQLNAISPDEVSVWAEPQKWQSRNDEDFQGDLFLGGTGGHQMPLFPEMSGAIFWTKALRCVHEHVSECHYGKRPWVYLILRMIGFLEWKKMHQHWKVHVHRESCLQLEFFFEEGVGQGNKRLIYNLSLLWTEKTYSNIFSSPAALVPESGQLDTKQHLLHLFFFTFLFFFIIFILVPFLPFRLHLHRTVSIAEKQVLSFIHFSQVKFLPVFWMTDLQLRSIVSPRLLNALLGALGRVGRWQDALAWCEAECWGPSRIGSNPLEFNIVQVCTLASTLLLTGWSGDIQDQHSVPQLKFMKKSCKNLSATWSSKDLQCYGKCLYQSWQMGVRLVYAWANSRSKCSALAKLEMGVPWADFKPVGFASAKVTYTIALNACEQGKLWQAALELLHDMKVWNFFDV